MQDMPDLGAERQDHLFHVQRRGPKSHSTGTVAIVVFVIFVTITLALTIMGWMAMQRLRMPELGAQEEVPKMRNEEELGDARSACC